MTQGRPVRVVHLINGLGVGGAESALARVVSEMDRARYDKLWQQFTEGSGKDRKKFVVSAVQGELPKTDDSPKYAGLST